MQFPRTLFYRIEVIGVTARLSAFKARLLFHIGIIGSIWGKKAPFLLKHDEVVMQNLMIQIIRVKLSRRQIDPSYLLAQRRRWILSVKYYPSSILLCFEEIFSSAINYCWLNLSRFVLSNWASILCAQHFIQPWLLYSLYYVKNLQSRSPAATQHHQISQYHGPSNHHNSKLQIVTKGISYTLKLWCRMIG